jgi:hypothetical protein
MGERDVAWKHGENLFLGFKCKYCVKEFCGGGATRLKEHLAGENENVAWCTIGESPDHESVIDSAKLIARWLYNHEKFHSMMKTAIGGNLMRWNATRFGTNYLS